MNHLSSYDGDPTEHIAIIGMTGRFPGAKDIHAFWQNLRDGVESITFFTAEDLAQTNIEPSLLENPRYVGADGVIEDMDLFDAGFFNIPPSVAEIMDPQHRLFLECAWELMEQAGYDSESYEGRVAVYGGANLSTYLVRNIMSHPDLRETATSFQTLITNDKDFIATRVSYKMNLMGPSMSVATLCSSSSVAIHLGCQTLLNYQCDLALAGAISLQASRNEAFFYQEGGIGDPDGHCRAFDARASGTVSGSGIGLVALKRLEDALAEGDHIHAVIRGTAVNNDGAIKYSYTAPSVEGQAEVIAEAIALAEVHPETITYVETHGTGTRLGDPIEVTALTKAFQGNGAQEKQYCAIGSVKTNIGHLVNAGGVASLIKTVLAMQHGQIPASLNYERPNPEIDFENSPFFVNAALREWRTDGFPRRAGVSSFGIGGTNVHIVVEEAPQVQPSGASRPWQLLVLSAQTEAALAKQTANLIAYLEAHPDASLADVAFTLQVGRRGFAHRRVLLCRDLRDAIEALNAQEPERVLTQFQETRNRPVAFMFPGPGEPQADGGLELYQGEPTFQEQINICAEILTPRLGIDLRRVLYPGAEKTEWAEQQRAQPAVARAALFALEYALARLWMEWGVEPQAMLGQGGGECVAACLAGVFSLQDALALIAGGAKLEPDRLNAPQIPFLSGASGSWITEAEATDPAYWARALDETRPFAEQVTPLLKEPEQALLEVGPGGALGALVRAHPDKAEQQVVLSSLGQGRDAPSPVADLLDTLGRLWLAGVRVDWYGFHAHERRHRLPLPTYPFQRQRYWIEPVKAGDRLLARDAQPEKRAVTKKPDIADWFYIPSWERSLLPPRPAETPVQACWLLFMDECGLGAQLARRLEQEGQRVVTVKAGPEFARLDDDGFVLNPGKRDDYGALLGALGALHETPPQVVHLWNVTGDGQDASVPDRFDQAQELGFYSLLFLSQELGQQGSADEVQITVVSNNLQQVTTGDLLHPEKVPLLGPVKVIPQEYPNLSCRSVDLAWPAADAMQARKLFEHLWTELTQPSSDTVVAYRGSHRWVQTFVPVRLDEGVKASSRLREQGVYLIVAGLEGIGLALAEHLARTVKARLALTQEAVFPDRDEWEAWPGQHGEEDGVARQIKKLQELEEWGAQVLVLRADATEKRAMQAVVKQVQGHFGQLDGVIYAAGNFGRTVFDSVEEVDRAACERQFRPAVQGSLALEEALSGTELDFCLLTSSLSSVLGGLGLVAYTAANSFIDALAQRNNGARALPWISVNWDGWKLGQAYARDALLSAHLDELAITPTEGAEAFERILSCGDAGQLIVSTADLQARIAQWLRREKKQEDGASGRKQRVTLHARPNLLNAFVAPSNKVQQTVAGIWQELLGIERIGIHDDFFELGGDSLLAVQIISRVRQTFEIDLPLSNLFEQPTVAFLADYIETLRWATQGQQAAVTIQGDGREEIEI